MQKPTNYDSVAPVVYGRTSLPPGGYEMIILGAQESKSRDSNRPMLILFLDVGTGEYKDYFKKLYGVLRAQNSAAKWPLTYRRCTDGDKTQYFKGDIGSIEHSNNMQWDWDVKSLVGKKVGCAIGEKEINEGGKKIYEVRFLCPLINVGSIKPPKVILYDRK